MIFTSTRHKESIKELKNYFLTKNWNCLLNNPSIDDVLKEIDSLSLSPLKQVKSPSILQFYYDLYCIDCDHLEANDILLSFLGEDAKSQEYFIFSGDSISDIMYMLETVKDASTLVFPGHFWDSRKNGDIELNTRGMKQRTFSAICVDIDPAGAPLSADSVDKVLLSLKEIPPSYVSLTGNGIHLWYMFDTPVFVFSKKSRRRERLKELVQAFYQYVEKVVEGEPLVVDKACATLNHGFRAPGSTTKYGDEVLSFIKGEGRIFYSPLEISRFLETSLELDSPIIQECDIVYRSFEECAKLKEEASLGRAKATEKQIETILGLKEAGVIKESEPIEGLNVEEASALINVSLSRKNANVGNLPSRPRWKTKPHRLIAGKSGGVYNTIYKQITKVDIGARYNALFMLAGVAYMMTKPAKSLEEVSEDFNKLLKSNWAKQGKPPLTSTDISKALKGYNSENWHTKKSIIKFLGFDPFEKSAKRNGRTQEDHLKNYLPKMRKDSTVKKMAKYLKEKPKVSKSKCSRDLDISRPTIIKYWEEAKKLAEII